MIEGVKDIAHKQLDFYRQGLVGCKFAEHAAKSPQEHKWGHCIIEHPNVLHIDREVRKAVDDPRIAQLSIIFPSVRTKQDLIALVEQFEMSEIFYFEPDVEFQNYICKRLRARILDKTSWVSGFAPMDFMPKTRRTPFTEIVLRVKNKPPYRKNIQPDTCENELHPGDLAMQGITGAEFTRMWKESFAAVKKVLGHNPDELSAARTSFVIEK